MEKGIFYRNLIIRILLLISFIYILKILFKINKEIFIDFLIKYEFPIQILIIAIVIYIIFNLCLYLSKTRKLTLTEDKINRQNIIDNIIREIDGKEINKKNNYNKKYLGSAPWGEGKTFIAKSIYNKLLANKSINPIYISVENLKPKNLSEYVYNAGRRTEFNHKIIKILWWSITDFIVKNKLLSIIFELIPFGSNLLKITDSDYDELISKRIFSSYVSNKLVIIFDELDRADYDTIKYLFYYMNKHNFSNVYFICFADISYLLSIFNFMSNKEDDSEKYISKYFDEIFLIRVAEKREFVSKLNLGFHEEILDLFKNIISDYAISIRNILKIVDKLNSLYFEYFETGNNLYLIQMAFDLITIKYHQNTYSQNIENNKKIIDEIIVILDRMNYNNKAKELSNFFKKYDTYQPYHNSVIIRHEFKDHMLYNYLRNLDFFVINYSKIFENSVNKDYIEKVKIIEEISNEVIDCFNYIKKITTEFYEIQINMEISTDRFYEIFHEFQIIISNLSKSLLILDDFKDQNSILVNSYSKSNINFIINEKFMNSCIKYINDKIETIIKSIRGREALKVLTEMKEYFIDTFKNT